MKARPIKSEKEKTRKLKPEVSLGHSGILLGFLFYFFFLEVDIRRYDTLTLTCQAEALTVNQINDP